MPVTMARAVPEYDVEVDEEKKLVNCLNRSNRSLIVQLSYTSIEEVFEDDFQSLIRDAVRSQCVQEDGDWKLVTKSVRAVADDDESDGWAMADLDEVERAQRPQGRLGKTIDLVDGADEGWAMAAAADVYGWREEARSTQQQQQEEEEEEEEEGSSSVMRLNAAADEDFTGDDAWEMAPAAEVYDGFFLGFADEHLTGWLREREHVALVRGEMDTIAGIGKLLTQAKTQRHVEVQELYIEGKLDQLYRGMCEQERRMGELSKFEKRLKEVIERLYYESEEVRQVKDLCSDDNDMAEMAFWDAVEARGMEKDFEIALRLQQEEKAREVSSSAKQGPGWGAMGDGASLLKALQHGGGATGVNSGANLLAKLKAKGDTSGASLLAALNAGAVQPSAPPARLSSSPSSSSSSSNGRKKGVTFRFGQPMSMPEGEFPALLPSSPPAYVPAAGRPTRRSGLLESMMQNKADPAKLYKADPAELSGFTKLSTISGLLVDNLKYDERDKILSDTERVMESAASRGVSADKMRAMMAKTAKDSAKLSYCERLMRDGPSKEAFSRKSMEKLKKDMIDAAGVVDWLLTGRPPRGDSTLTRAPVRFARSLGLGQYTQCDTSHLPEGDACARLLRVGAAVHRSENHGGVHPLLTVCDHQGAPRRLAKRCRAVRAADRDEAAGERAARGRSAGRERERRRRLLRAALGAIVRHC